jgi:hypothetical protein
MRPKLAHPHPGSGRQFEVLRRPSIIAEPACRPCPVYLIQRVSSSEEPSFIECVAGQVVSAASRRDAPVSTASITRSRRSPEYDFGIAHPPHRRINAQRLAHT